MFLLYNFLLTLLAPLWAPLLWIKSRKRKEPPNWNERFGLYTFARGKDERWIWVHAVSVGETMAAQPILAELRKVAPDCKILLSATTSSGHRAASEHLVGLYDALVYFPIDVVRFQLSAMIRVRPKAIAIMETELWPNFLWAAGVVNARVLMVNGQIKDRNFARSRNLRFFYRWMLGQYHRVLAQSETDAERLRFLGASNVEVFGNSKFDQLAAETETNVDALRREYGVQEGEKVVVIGSTRGADEEMLVASALKMLGRSDVRVIHAPRHIERAEAVLAEAERSGFAVGRRSLGETAPYLVLDTYGELAKLFAIADVAIIGGGFGEYGGQSPIQALAAGKPVLCGPHMENFRDIVDASVKAGATKILSTPSELCAELKFLLSDDAERARRGEFARKLIDGCRGAARRYAEAIAEEANKS